MAKGRAVVLAVGRTEDGRQVRLLAPPPRVVWSIEAPRTLFRIVAKWRHAGALRYQLEFTTERREVESHGAPLWIEVEQLGVEATIVGALCNRLWELEGLSGETPWIEEVVGAAPAADEPSTATRATCSGLCDDLDGFHPECPLHGGEAAT